MVHSDNEVSVLRNGGSGAPGITLGSNGGAGGGSDSGQTLVRLVRLVKLKEFRITFRDFRRNGWLGWIWGEQRRREGGEDQGGERLSGTYVPEAPEYEYPSTFSYLRNLGG